MLGKRIVHGVSCTLGHDNPAIRRFMRDNRLFFVPVKIWGRKAHDGEKHKPETGRMNKSSFHFA